MKAEPAQSISRLCLDGEAIVSGAKLCSVRESPTEIVSTLVTGPGEEVSQSPTETVSTLSAVSQPCQGGGAGVSGAESHPVEAVPPQTVSTLSAVSQPCQEGGAGVRGAQSHPVEAVPAQTVSTMITIAQSGSEEAEQSPP